MPKYATCSAFSFDCLTEFLPTVYIRIDQFTSLDSFLHHYCDFSECYVCSSGTSCSGPRLFSWKFV